MTSTGDPLTKLGPREMRGSRARCLALTDGPDEVVASRLCKLFGPYAAIDHSRHVWQPRGFAAPDEAKLGEAPQFLTADHRDVVTGWWLAVRGRANTPNWDIACTATIDGAEGLLLVEAKAHANEIKNDGKSAKGNVANHARITAAIVEASDGLNTVLPGWALSVDRCYQLCNRFAWAWKIASLGVPVLLVYLGFLRADEMADVGEPLVDHDNWERLVREHGQPVVPPEAWDTVIDVRGTALRAVIRSAEVGVPGDRHGLQQA